MLQPLEDIHVARVAQRHGRSAAQVLLRHALQHGTVVIPKSERAQRLRETLGLQRGGASIGERSICRYIDYVVTKDRLLERI